MSLLNEILNFYRELERYVQDNYKISHNNVRVNLVSGGLEKIVDFSHLPSKRATYATHVNSKEGRDFENFLINNYGGNLAEVVDAREADLGNSVIAALYRTVGGIKDKAIMLYDRHFADKVRYLGSKLGLNYNEGKELVELHETAHRKFLTEDGVWNSMIRYFSKKLENSKGYLRDKYERMQEASEAMLYRREPKHVYA